MRGLETSNAEGQNHARDELLAPTLPTMKVLYVSGYADESFVRRGMLEPGVSFLKKPFTSEIMKVCGWQPVRCLTATTSSTRQTWPRRWPSGSAVATSGKHRAFHGRPGFSKFPPQHHLGP